MSEYKVIQDVEAEDKLVGPLSLRQFIYAGIAATCCYLTFLSFSKNVPFLSVMFVPIALFTGFFAFPWGKDQPTEVWAIAKIRFMLKPRKRIWDQSGAKELVTINVPKQVVRVLTNGLNQSEVQSRLEALASTIDSRGWATKNANVNMYSQATAMPVTNSDRLVGPSAFPQEVSNVDVRAADDILDPNANPVAHNFDSMMQASSQAKRAQLMQTLQGNDDTPVSPATEATGAPANYWFMQQPTSVPAGQAMFASDTVVSPGSYATNDQALPHAAEPTPAEQAMVEKFKEENQANMAISQGHMKVIKTPEQIEAEAAARAQVEAALQSQQQQQAKATVTPADQAAIMALSRNDDLDVATLGRQLQKTPKASNHDGMVVVPLR